MGEKRCVGTAINAQVTIWAIVTTGRTRYNFIKMSLLHISSKNVDHKVRASKIGARRTQ